MQVDNMVSLYVEGEPLTPLEFILGAIPLLLLPGLVILFVFWLFFQAAINTFGALGGVGLGTRP